MKKLFNNLIAYRFLSLCGIAMGAYIFSLRSEFMPLTSFLLEMKTYLIALLIVLGFRLFIWISIDKATFYDISSLIKNIIVDYIMCVLMMICTIGTLFVVDTFILS